MCYAWFETSAFKRMGTALSWGITQRVVVIFFYRIQKDPVLFDSWSLKKEPIGCPETSVKNYHSSLRDNPEERSSDNTENFLLMWTEVL